MATYTFPKLRTHCLWFAGVSVGFVVLAVIGAKHTPLLTDLLVAGALYVPFAAIGLVAITTFTPVVLNAQGVSRQFFGRPWQVLPWGKVREVVISLTRHADSPDFETTVVLLPTEKSGTRLGVFGKIAFNLTMRDLKQFRTEFNGYLTQHRIPVEDRRGDLAKDSGLV